VNGDVNSLVFNAKTAKIAKGAKERQNLPALCGLCAFALKWEKTESENGLVQHIAYRRCWQAN
jgi:hypothetical protein